jgi:hypothetical protein
VHFEERSVSDPTYKGREAGLIGGGSAVATAVSLPVAVVSTVLSAGFVSLNEPHELRALQQAHAKEFVRIRAALGGYDCRPQLARELDWALAESHPWLGIERVRVTDDLRRDVARAYANEAQDTLIVVDAVCGMSVDLGEARIDVRVEIFSRRFGPLAHAVEQDDGPPVPAVWFEEPVYRSRLVGSFRLSLAEYGASLVAARKAEIEATYGPRLAEARTATRKAELEKWRKAALASAEGAGRFSYSEYLELAHQRWLEGEPTALQRQLEAGTKLVAAAIAEDIGKEPEPQGRTKRAKKRWVHKRPVVVEPPAAD